MVKIEEEISTEDQEESKKELGMSEEKMQLQKKDTKSGEMLQRQEVGKEEKKEKEDLIQRKEN